jgi:hypothetical protein
MLSRFAIRPTRLSLRVVNANRLSMQFFDDALHFFPNQTMVVLGVIRIPLKRKNDRNVALSILPVSRASAIHGACRHSYAQRRDCRLRYETDPALVPVPVHHPCRPSLSTIPVHLDRERRESRTASRRRGRGLDILFVLTVL